jgi:hypothetical protein
MLLGTRAFLAELDRGGTIVGYDELETALALVDCAELVPDGRGSHYLAGHVERWLESTLPLRGVFVAKLPATGAPWVTELMNVAEYAYAPPGGLAVDGDGNAYVVGVQETIAGIWEAFAAKLGAGGGVVWGPRPFGWATEFNALALDARGDLYAPGSIGDYRDVVDATLAKLDPGGGVLWPPKPFATGGAEYHVHYATALALDANGNVFVAASTDAGAVVAKFDPLGILQ